MYTLIITRTIRDIPTAVAFPLSGHEAAYAAFEMACELCELTGGTVMLTDTDTGEVLADNTDD